MFPPEMLCRSSTFCQVYSSAFFPLKSMFQNFFESAFPSWARSSFSEFSFIRSYWLLSVELFLHIHPKMSALLSECQISILRIFTLTFLSGVLSNCISAFGLSLGFHGGFSCYHFGSHRNVSWNPDLNSLIRRKDSSNQLNHFSRLYL